MTFRQAVERTARLTSAWRAGLQALSPADRARLTLSQPGRLAGSVNLDAAFARSLPASPRWDYGIAYRDGPRQAERICWLEVRPSTPGEVPVVLGKQAWLLSWLADEGVALDRFPREFVWVSSGRTSVTRNSPQAKRLSARGIRLAGARLRLV